MKSSSTPYSKQNHPIPKPVPTYPYLYKMITKLIRSFSSKDYYKILGLPKTASKSDIRAAYLQLAKQYHPDSKTGNEEKFKEIGEAWSVLRNDSSKSTYDSSSTSNSSTSQSGFNYEYTNATRSGYYRKNDYEKWKEFYRQRYESKDASQKEFDSFFEHNTKTSQERQKRRAKVYEFIDPRTGKKYFYNFTSTDSLYQDAEDRRQKIYKNFYDQKNQKFMNKQEEEEYIFVRNFSIASMIFTFVISFTIMARIWFPKETYYESNNGYPGNYSKSLRKNHWEDFDEEFQERLRRKGE